MGISLTFGVNSLWQKREEKKRTKEMLILVRNELVSNKNHFKFHEKEMKKDGYIYKMILDAKNDLTAIPKDTLELYYTRTMNIRIVPISTSAWQILQNSEMIQKMTNKELVIRLTDCYTAMNAWYEFITNDYWNVKKKMIFLDEGDAFKFFVTILKNAEFRNFFDKFRVDQESIWMTFFGVDAFIDYTLFLLDKHGDYRYDMDENDNELQKFANEKYDREFLKKDTINNNLIE